MRTAQTLAAATYDTSEVREGCERPRKGPRSEHVSSVHVTLALTANGELRIYEPVKQRGLLKPEERNGAERSRAANLRRTAYPFFCKWQTARRALRRGEIGATTSFATGAARTIARGEMGRQFWSSPSVPSLARMYRI
jgi:hypothetical protein